MSAMSDEAADLLAQAREEKLEERRKKAEQRWRHFTEHEMRDLLSGLDAVIEHTQKKKDKIAWNASNSVAATFDGRLERLGLLKDELREVLENVE